MIDLGSGEYMFRLRSYVADQSSSRHDEPERIVLGSHLYFPGPKQMNDPHEGAPQLRWSQNGSMTRTQIRDMVRRQASKLSWSKQYELRDAIWRRSLNPEVRMRFRESVAEWLSGTFLGSSLCSFFPSLDFAKWAAYGDTGRGYALVFRRSTEWVFDVGGQHFVSGAPRVRMRALPVEYSNTYPEIDLDMDWFDSDNGWDAIRRGLLTKVEQWKHEAELRVIRPGVSPGEQQFSLLGLTGVIVGHNSSAELIARMSSLTSERRPQIPLFRSIARVGEALPGYELIS